MAFNIMSTAFEYGVTIPDRYTCMGENISPPLRWDNAPKATVTYALIMEDPDAPGGTFVHWIIYNLPEKTLELEKNIPLEKKMDNGALHAKNDYGRYGYSGPCPPKGKEHRYFFRIYALRNKLQPESISDGESFHELVQKYSLAKAEYMGKYRS